MKIWSCPVYVPVSQLIYAAFRSNAKGLLPPRLDAVEGERERRVLDALGEIRGRR